MQIIELRASDGSAAPETYRPLTTPGAYVPTTVPLFSTMGATTPWVMASGSQFRPGPPPALGSEVWTRDVNEIREVGNRSSTTRTPEQTTIGSILVLCRCPHLQSDREAGRNGQGHGSRRLRPAVRADVDCRQRRLRRRVRRKIPLQSLAADHGHTQRRPDVESGDAS